MVTAGNSSECDVGISGGVISEVGGAPSGRRYLDASGTLVLPGGPPVPLQNSLQVL